MLTLSNGLSGKETVKTTIGELPLHLTFDRVLRWYDMLERDDMDDVAKVEAGWYLFVDPEAKHDFDEDPSYINIAAQTMADLSDYIAEDAYTSDQDGGDAQGTRPEKWFSYDKDAEAIYASFMYDYQIDLVDQVGHMRWEKFHALFNNLSPKSPLMRIIDIRQRDLTGLEGKELADLVEAQDYYRLEGASVDNLNAAFGDMFAALKAKAEGR
ncbi:hypothetical protein LROSL1_1197 [Furfurilactobacillus rossiae]|uniref:Gp15 family bacteriophage protein n=1 Tax=Furfurilactobacillus rossiae TaxID=231049 RepID=UPI0015BE3A62|nr:Gp15 family bacteriophage protein [Furfurilactobacillus rossiae]QLE64014.1 hypothetical protein LROSL1_1197 [Furfurilactobacillus rossiae]